MTDSEDYQHSPELLELLVDAVWQLVTSKPKLLDFFRGSGTSPDLLAPYEKLLKDDPAGFKMPIVARQLLQGLNQLGDPGLHARRKIIQRVVEWEDFSTAWPQRRDAAELAVNRVRTHVNRADSFTRARQEADKLLEKHRAEQRQRQADQESRAKQRSELRQRLSELSSFDDPVERGHTFESLLNALFKHERIGVSESFRVVRDGTVEEQIDGVVSVNSVLHLVEVKWHKKPLGPEIVAQHMSRLLVRPPTVGGIYVARHGFTPAAISQMEQTLPHRLTVCSDWHEILYALEREYPIAEMVTRKIAAAINRKNVYFRFGFDFFE